MRNYSAIRELCHGNLRPCDRGFSADTDFAITGETGNRFDEPISRHKNIVDAMSFETFRTGFQLGVMMVMEATIKNEAICWIYNTTTINRFRESHFLLCSFGYYGKTR